MKILTFRPLPGAVAVLFVLGIFTGCGSKLSTSADEEKSMTQGQSVLCAGLSSYACAAKMQDLRIKKEQEVSARAEKERMQKIPHADPSTPESQFVRLESGYQIAAIFYALSGLPPNYDVLAGAASEEYRRTTDEFRRRDLREALRSKVDADIAHYKDPHNRYLAVAQESVPIQHYDFKTSSFPITLPIGPGSFVYYPEFPQYKIAYRNGNDFLRFPVADQQRAKEIESMVSRYELAGGEALLYVFVTDANPADNAVNGQIVRVVLMNNKHTEVARF